MGAKSYFLAIVGVLFLSLALEAQDASRRPIPPTLEPPNPNESFNLGDDAARVRAKTDPEFIVAPPPPSTTAAPGILSRTPGNAVVYRCYFDGETDGNQDRWPDAWTRQTGIGYPEYLNIEVERIANPVNFRALRVNLEGGNVLLRTPKIPIIPELSYTVSSYIRTEKLVHDEVAMILSFYDREGKPLQTHSSVPFRDSNGWREVRLGPFPAEFPGAAFAQIAFHITTGKRQDLSGTVDIAAVEMTESPTVRLTTINRDHIFTDPKGIEVQCLLSGLSTLQNRLRFVLEDAFGQVLDQTSLALRLDDGPETAFILRPQDSQSLYRARGQWVLPIRFPGYYRVRIEMDGIDPRSPRSRLSLAVLNPASVPNGGEFGWSLPKENFKDILAQRALLSQAGISWLKVPVWSGAKTTTDEWDEIASLCEWLNRSLGLSLVGLFADPPEEVRQKITETPLNAARIFSTSPETWFPSISPSLMRLALIRYWQLGEDEDRSIVEIDPLGPQLDRIREEFDKIAPAAGIGFGWDWNRPVPDDFPTERQEEPTRAASGKFSTSREFLSLSSADPLTSLELGEYLKRSEATRCERFVVLRPISKAGYSLEDRINDMVQRMITAKNDGAKAVFVPEPFNDETGLMNAGGTPGELFLPWRTTALMIGGKQFAGRIALPGQSENMIFARENDSVMVVWNDAASRENPVDEVLFLGTDCEIVDLWGKRSKPTKDGRAQVVPVGPLPSFVTGVDMTVARIRQGFELEKKRIPSQCGPKIPNTFSFANNSNHGLGGSINLVAPPGWNVDPVSIPLNLAEGETLKTPFSIVLTPRAVSGSQPFRIDCKLEGLDPGTGEFSVYERINVGEGDVYLEPPITHLNVRTNELTVRQALINDSEKPVSFKCTLSIPGRQMQKMMILNQGFGRHDHRYVIPQGDALLGKTLGITASEIGGSRTLKASFQANK